MEQDDENNIDLDTRIAMMFKEKSFGAAPPFLQLDDSESDTEKEERTTTDAASVAAVGTADNAILEKIKTEMNADNSMDNMMQIAGDAISNDSVSMKSNSVDSGKMKLKKKIIEDGASDISSDDEVLACTPPPLPASGSKAPSIPPPPPIMAGDIKLEDDKMSLSSLSSTEEKSNNRKAIATDMDPHKNVVPSMPDYYYPPTGGVNPYYYPNGENTAIYDPYSGMPTTHGSYIQPYIGGFPPIIPANYVQSTDYPSSAVATKQQQQQAVSSSDPIASNNEPKNDPSERTISAAIERVKMELKQILKKDFNKRMIESIAFKKYEAWWDEQAKAQNKTKSSSSAAA